MKRPIVTIVIAVAIATVRLARPDTAPIRIEYHADSTCPSEEDFRTEVAARAAQVTPRYGRDARLFVVTITGTADQALGRLQIWGNGGSVFDREVTGENCGEVASALALVTALAIDPQSFTAPSAFPSATAAPSSAVAPPASPSPSPARIQFTV